MDNAVVTITCPSCGGRVDGVETTSAEQTIPCKFCGTELHIPRIGEVVHEVVREVREVPVDTAPTPEPVDVPKAGPTIVLILVVAAALLVIPLTCYLQHDADDTQQEWKKQEEARERCEANCRSSCAKGSTKGDDPFDNMMQNTDRMMCESTCTTRCYQTDPR
ncbi:MAG TPA: hypothetical protein VL172_08490 [Kofleriaceae bacterium]|nr:hypothetical protein [Kofleriaceae bacterium]